MRPNRASSNRRTSIRQKARRKASPRAASREPAAVNQAKLLLDQAWDQDDTTRLATEERLQRELLARLAAAAAGQA